MVVTDWNSAGEMIAHGYAADLKHAAELAVNAGVDMDMMSYSYIQYIEELIKEGKVSEKDIDNAVRNILKLKFELGLFDNPTWTPRPRQGSTTHPNIWRPRSSARWNPRFC